MLLWKVASLGGLLGGSRVVCGCARTVLCIGHSAEKRPSGQKGDRPAHCRAVWYLPPLPFPPIFAYKQVKVNITLQHMLKMHWGGEILGGGFLKQQKEEMRRTHPRRFW